MLALAGIALVVATTSDMGWLSQACASTAEPYAGEMAAAKEENGEEEATGAGDEEKKALYGELGGPAAAAEGGSYVRIASTHRAAVREAAERSLREASSMLRVLPPVCFSTFFWIAYNQMSGNFYVQACQMDLRLGGGSSQTSMLSNTRRSCTRMAFRSLLSASSGSAPSSCSSTTRRAFARLAAARAARASRFARAARALDAASSAATAAAIAASAAAVALAASAVEVPAAAPAAG